MFIPLSIGGNKITIKTFHLHLYRHVSPYLVQIPRCRSKSNVTKESLLGRRVFVPLFVPLKSIPLFPKRISEFSVYKFLLFHISLVSCSIFKIAYPYVLENLLKCLMKERRLVSRTYMYIGGYSAGAGSSLA